jgi:hypothetical protein
MSSFGYCDQTEHDLMCMMFAYCYNLLNTITLSLFQIDHIK